MPPVFDAASLEREYEFLDACPEDLLADVITLPLGTLEERSLGVEQWRQSLLQGQLPAVDAWPSSALGSAVHEELAALRIARFCRENEEVTNALMKDILAAFTRRHGAIQERISARLRELERLERERLAKEPRRHREPARVPTPEDLARLSERAKREIAEDEHPGDGILAGLWGERARAWSSLAEVFDDLGQLLGRGWDMSHGVLRHVGWMDVVRIKELLAQLPQIKAIVQSLGRLQTTQEGESVADTIFTPARRLEEELHEEHAPHVPAEVRGIERSGDIARMLPVEASMLGHPKLQLLWHARRAERALLTYMVEGIEVEVALVERDAEEESEERRPRRDRGPIVAVIDTSGSMHGVPEQVAKALVLEAMNVANAEGRKCYLYAYSGPGQVAEHELDLSAEGIGRLIDFLLLSFGGGTDLGVMRQVVTRLETDAWSRADVVLVTDGEWEAPPDVRRAVLGATETHGTRFHGVQIGNIGSSGLHELCDPVHVFRDWLAAGGRKA